MLQQADITRLIHRMVLEEKETVFRNLSKLISAGWTLEEIAFYCEYEASSCHEFLQSY